MKVLILGATGMVGSELLHYCLNQKQFTEVLTLGRNKSQVKHSKHKNILHKNFLDFSTVKEELKKIDICF